MVKARLFWVVRWLLALPVASVAAFAVTIPVHLAVLLLKFTYESGQTVVTFDPGTFPVEIVERLGYAFFTAATFVYCAGRVVPAHRLQVASVLALLWAVGIGSGWTFMLLRGHLGSVFFYSPGGWPYIIIAVSLGLVGVVTGVYSLYRWERRPT